jgi:hypothetical protein
MTRAVSQSDGEGLVAQSGRGLHRAASSSWRTFQAQTESAPLTGALDDAIQPCAVSAVAGSGRLEPVLWRRLRRKEARR